MWPVLIAVVVAGGVAALFGFFWRRSPRPLRPGARVLVCGVDEGNVAAALARRAASGNYLVLTAFGGNTSGAEKEAQRCRQLGAKEVVLVDNCNLCREEDRIRVAKAVGDEPLDMIALCHVTSALGNVLDAGFAESLQRTIAVNVISVRNFVLVLLLDPATHRPCTLQYVETLRQLERHLTRSCRIVLFSSVAGTVPMPRRSAYAASKAALTSVVDCLAAERPELDISLIFPGMIATPVLLTEYEDHVVKANSVSPESLVDAIFTSRQRFKIFHPFSGFFASLIHCLYPSFLRSNIGKLLPKMKL